MQSENSEKKLLPFPLELKVLVFFHFLINISFFIYLNKNNAIIKFFPSIIRNPSLMASYYSVIINDFRSCGLFFYFVLHFSFLFSVIVAVYFILKIIAVVFKLKNYRILFSCVFGVMLSFIYFILIYNAITFTLFDSLIYGWNIKYLFIMATKICSLINFNIFYIFLISFLFILMLTILNFFAFSRWSYCYPHVQISPKNSRPFNFATKIRRYPFLLVGATLLLVNIAWADSSHLVRKEVFFTWLMDENIWNFSTVSYSDNTEKIFQNKNTNKFIINGTGTTGHTHGPFKKEKLPNIIIVVSDSLRSDHLGFKGYYRDTTPFIDSLYNSNKIESTNLATSTCSETMCGIGSILLSKAYDKMKNGGIRLHKILQSIGYHLHFYSSDIPNYKGLYFLYGVNQNSIYNCTKSKKFRAFDDNVILDGLRSLKPTDGTPHFFFFHIMSSHIFGKRFNRFLHYTPSQCVCSPRFKSKDKSIIKADRNCYDNGVEQADFIIKNIYNALKQTGYLKNSIFVIIGDHGEGLGERGYFNHTNYLYQEFIKIPLIFIRTNRERPLYLDYATQIDLAPTLLDLIGVNIPQAWDGKALTSEHDERVTFHQTTFRNPIRVNIVYRNNTLMKYMKSNGRCLAYDLKLDPQEINPHSINCNLMPGNKE